ncbi:MAG: AMP-binding protein [Cyclobacteriaceae bacterium]|nr:AMP-binding protein [Cyclobacteriaceae bacterium]
MGFRLFHNGKTFGKRDLLNNGELHHDPVVSFCYEWLSGKEYFIFKTSGSTGTPSEITVSRAAMKASADKTIAFFGLQPEDRALLCMSAVFTGGKMMLVRAMEGELHLYSVPPSSNPLENTLPPLDFAAFVPLQFHNLLNTTRFDSSLNHMKGIIIGGSGIGEELWEKCQRLTCPVYSTYGMTETVSHVALMKINGDEQDSYYTVLPHIKIKYSEDNCLMITGDVTDFQPVKTNDLVNIINERQFEWLGRKDNIINSGSIKVSAEILEKKMESIFKSMGFTFNFFVTGIPHKVLGEQIIMILEGEPLDKEVIINPLRRHLEKFELPKNILSTDSFEYTSSGKIDRVSTILKIGL